MTATLLALLVVSQVELAGLSVTPQIATPEMAYRRGVPEPPRSALVRLFLRNAGPEAVTLREAFFDRQSPLSLVPNGDWAWADIPSAWTGEAPTLPSSALVVFTFNGQSRAWNPGRRTTVTLEADGPPGSRWEFPVTLAPSPRRLNAVTVLDRDDGQPGQRLVVHVANGGDRPVRIAHVRLWLPGSNARYRILHPGEPLTNLDRFPAEAPIAPGDAGVAVATVATPLPRNYAAVEVSLTDDQNASSSVWGHVRLRPETFDISGGWVDGDAADGSRLLSKEPFLQTLNRLHINTAHISDTPGYTDQTGPDGLYTKHPLKFFHFLMPVETWDTDERLPRIHAAEYLGEPQLGGWNRRPMHPQEVFARLQRYAPSRIASTVTLSDPATWHLYAGLSDYPHYDAYRVTAPSPDSFRAYDRWGPENRIGWAAPLETIGSMTRTLRDLSRPRAIAVWSQGPHRGWSGMAGRSRGSPTPDELRAQALHALAARVTSLYWFNLSLASLVAYRDTLEPLARIGREIRALEPLLLAGDAYRHERLVTPDGRPDWDLSTIAAPQGAALFALDLAYTPDPEARVFRFGPPREAAFTFALPAYLRPVRQVMRLDENGFTAVPFEPTDTGVTIRDTATHSALYVAAPATEIVPTLQARFDSARAAEAAIPFDPARNDAHFQALINLLPEKDRPRR
jgi:hypothetical protein